jgi:hypothetical protein
LPNTSPELGGWRTAPARLVDAYRARDVDEAKVLVRPHRDWVTDFARTAITEAGGAV